MALIESIKQLLGGATNAIANLKKAEAGIRERLGSLDQEEGRLLSLPAPLADVEASLKALVADLGRPWSAANGLAVIRAASGRIERAMGLADQRPPDTLQPGRLADVLAGPLTLDALAAIAPDVAVKGLVAIVKATPYEAGPPMPDRLTRLAAIEEERQALQARHAELVDEASEADLPMEHLPEERGRRWRAAQRREAWERDQRANADYYRRNPSARPPEPE
jgi:hypothetical protein